MFGRLIVAATIGIACGAVVVVGSQSSSGGSAVLVTAPGNQSAAHGGPRGAFNWGMVLAISPDGRVLASGAGDKAVRLWSLPQGDRLRTLGGHRAAIRNLAFTPDSKLLAASDDKAVSLWSVADGRRVATLGGHPASVRGVWITPDGNHILTQAGGELRIWTVPDGRLETTKSFIGDRDRASRVAFMADSRMLAIAADAQGVEKGTDPGIVLLSLPDLTEVATLKRALPPENVLMRRLNALAAVLDGTSLVAGSEGDIVSWSLADRSSTPVADEKGASRLVVTPDGKTLVAGFRSGDLRVWNLGDRRQVAATKAHADAIEGLAVTADGRVAASGSSDSTARLWSLAGGQPIAVLKGHKGVVSHVLFTPDGATLVTGQESDWASTGISYDGGRVVMHGKEIRADAVIALWNVNPPKFLCYLAK